jgi:hypothetical protein
MALDFKAKATPDVRIKYKSSRTPFAWLLGDTTIGYGKEDLIGPRDLGFKNAVYWTELDQPVWFSAITDFSGTDRFPVFWEWDFGDGFSFRNSETAVHSYSLLSLEGRDTVQAVLTVTDNKGGKWRARAQVYLVIPPEFKPVGFTEAELLIPPSS